MENTLAGTTTVSTAPHEPPGDHVVAAEAGLLARPTPPSTTDVTPTAPRRRLARRSRSERAPDGAAFEERSMVSLNSGETVCASGIPPNRCWGLPLRRRR